MPSLQESYAAAGFSSALKFGARPALLVVDMVEAYLQTHSPLYLPLGPCALSNTIEIASHCSAIGAPVILTEVSYDHMAQAGRFFEKAPALELFKSGAPLAKIAPQLLDEDRSTTIITKHYASAFFGTDLASFLTHQRVDTVIIAGFSTSGCVRASALDALQHGFAPFVASDACADRDEGPHESNLFDLQAKYAEVIDTLAIKSLLSEIKNED